MKSTLLNILLLNIISIFSYGQDVSSDGDKFKLEDCENVEKCIEIAIQLRGENSYEKADSFFQKCLILSKKNSNSKILPKLFYHFGMNSRKLSNYEESINIFNQFLALPSASQQPYLADVYSELSKAHQHSGNLEKAYQLQLNSLQIHELSNDSIQIMKGVFELGSIFFY